MPSLEQYLNDADRLAQDVVNAWGVNAQARQLASLDQAISGFARRGLSLP
jgi:hypothetical protein